MTNDVSLRHWHGLSQLFLLSFILFCLHVQTAQAAPETAERDAEPKPDTIVNAAATTPLLNSATVAGGGALLPLTSNVVSVLSVWGR